MSAIIYLVTNTINGKQYVGFTTQAIYDRMKAHRHYARKGSQGAFHRAIRKYGWDNFAVDIIFEHDDADFTLKVMEPHFIAWYDTFGPGYNMTKGGEGVSNPGVPKSKAHAAAAARAKRKPIVALGYGWPIVFDSATQAANQLGINRACISSACNGNYHGTHRYKGYEFHFKRHSKTRSS
jgi:hypothetical protein